MNRLQHQLLTMRVDQMRDQMTYFRAVGKKCGGARAGMAVAYDKVLWAGCKL